MFPTTTRRGSVALGLLLLLLPVAPAAGVDFVIVKPGSGGGSAVVTETFSTDPSTNGAWNVYRAIPDTTNEAAWDSAAGTLFVTRAVNSRAAALFSTTPLTAQTWEAEFDYRVGGGTGADGFVFLFYADESGYLSAPPADGGRLGFGTGSPAQLTGYGIEFDSYQNAQDPQTNHVALIKGDADTHLAWAASAVIEDDLWHRAKIRYASGTVEVWIDGAPILTHSLASPNTSPTGWGFSAATGAANNNHQIDNVVLRV